MFSQYFCLKVKHNVCQFGNPIATGTQYYVGQWIAMIMEERKKLHGKKKSLTNSATRYSTEEELL